MSWAGLANNQTVSFSNLQNAVSSGIFVAKTTIPTSTEQITKADADTYVDINTSFASYAAKASNQLVVKSNLEWCNNSENQLHAYQNGLNVSIHKKLVLDLETGVYYDSATELANLLGMNRVTLICRLNGNRHEIKRYKYA
jgi:hypothetical protein